MQTIAILLVGGYAAFTAVVVFFFFTGYWEYAEYISHNVGRVYLYVVTIYTAIVFVYGILRAIYSQPLYYYGLMAYIWAELALSSRLFCFMLGACSLLAPAFIRKFLYSKWIQAQMTYTY